MRRYWNRFLNWLIPGRSQRILAKMMKYDQELGLYEQLNWKLVREGDGLTKVSEDIMWIEFNEEGRFKDKFDKVAVGRSLIMSPFNQFFTWQTTTVTEVLEQKENYIKFKTLNSTYDLFKL